MKGILKFIALTAIAGAMLATVVSATQSAEKPPINYGIFEEEDPTLIYAPQILAKMEAKEFTGKDGVLKYRVYESPAYKTKDDSTPALLLVFLHGSGGSGDDNELQIKDQRTMVNYLVSDLGDQLFADIPFKVIAPQCPADSQWAKIVYANGSYSTDNIEISAPLQLVYELITDLQAKEGFTTANTVIGGISMGGYGTWDLATRHPEICGTIIPICGAGDPSKANLIKDKRIWVFHSDNDGAVPVSGSRDMVAALKEAGAENLTYTEFQGKGHNAWTPAMTEVKDPYLLEWFFEGRTYSVTTEVEGEGEITESVMAVKGGDTVKIEFTPAEGYAPDKVYVDGTEVTPTVPQEGAMYITLEKVDANHKVKAVFTKMADEESSEDEAVEAEGNGLSIPAIIALAGGAVAVAAAVTTAIVVSKKKKK